MDLSALDASTATCMTPEELQQAPQSSCKLSAKHASSKENGMSASHNNKLRAALAWLGDRYLCAKPQLKRVRK